MMANPFLPNPKQAQAIEHVHGPMLVLAGAGTGKTTVLVERIAKLIENGHATPDQILAITFTDNAAAELKARVEKRLRRKAVIAAGTFHAYCFGLLKRASNDFYTLLPEDVYVFLRQRIDQLGLKHFIKPSDLGQFLDDLRSFFDRCNEELIGPEDFQKYVDSLGQGTPMPRNCRSKEAEQLGEAVILERWQEIARVYANSMRLLDQNNLGTFGLQISRAVGLLQRDRGLLELERRRAKFILIDEFQDCNSSNIILAELLARGAQNVFAVGDPDQAIYRFRGASSAAFEEFQRRFPQTESVTLAENQRSRGNILRVAFAAIRKNPGVASLGRKVKFERRELESARDRREREQGNLVFDVPVETVISTNDEQEASDIAREIAALRATGRKGAPLSLAVLYRQHAHREKIVSELMARDIPFVVRGIGVTDTAAGRDLLAAVRAVACQNDAESLFRVAAFPRFNLDPLELRKKLAAAHRDKPFAEVLKNMDAGRRLLETVEQARRASTEQGTGAAALFAQVIRDFELDSADPVMVAFTRFVETWEEKPFIQDKSADEFLRYLDYFQQARGTVPLWTEDQVQEIEREHPEAVRLMTVHAAKGLEFDRVWILRVVSNAFPTNYREPLFEFPPALRSSVATGDSKEVHEQEERRLFYVAITRARDALAMHGRHGRSRDKTPTGFLRPLLADRGLGLALQTRETGALSGCGSATTANSAVADWLLLPPEFDGASLSLSANAVESYSTCPLKFKLERDWDIPGEVAASLQYGNAIHTVLRKYYVPKPGEPLLSTKDVIAAFKEQFDKPPIEDQVQRRLYIERGTEQLQGLLSTQPRGSVDVIDAEVSFKFLFNGREIRGRIDRLDRIEGKKVRVIDYKTGVPKTQEYADRSLQLSIYAMGAAKIGFDPRELAFLNLQGNETVLTRRTLIQLERAEQKIQETADGMAAGQFEPRPGQHCRWCDYRRLCPATEQQALAAVKEKAAEVSG